MKKIDNIIGLIILFAAVIGLGVFVGFIAYLSKVTPFNIFLWVIGAYILLIGPIVIDAIIPGFGIRPVQILKYLYKNQIYQRYYRNRDK